MLRDELAETLWEILSNDASDAHTAKLKEILQKYKSERTITYKTVMRKGGMGAMLFNCIEEALYYRHELSSEYEECDKC